MRDPDFQEFDRDYHGSAASAYGAPRPDLWQRLSRVMEVFLYLLILAAILRLFWPEVEKQRALNAELAHVEREKAEREARVAELREEYGLLKSDRDYIETVARDQLDMAREGEYIIRIERPEERELALPEGAASSSGGIPAPPKIKPLKALPRE